MYGVDTSKPGAQDYYNSVFELFAYWGVDFVKVDDICNTNMYPNAPYSGRREIEMIRNAIDACGRPMVLSLSPGPAPITEAWHLSQNANMWRITDDFWDRWELLLDMFKRCELWQAHVRPGTWPDCDMLPLGAIAAGFNEPRKTKFTRDEQRTLMSLWCIFRSPLMMGGNLVENDEFTLSLLTNAEVLEALIKGGKPRQLFRDERQAAWASTAEADGYYLALFNIGNEDQTIHCSLDYFGMENAHMRDLWIKTDKGKVNKEIAEKIAPHGVVFLRLLPL